MIIKAFMNITKRVVDAPINMKCTDYDSLKDAAIIFDLVLAYNKCYYTVDSNRIVALSTLFYVRQLAYIFARS